MSNPHCETGSQDVITIQAAKESLITLHEVTALRFLLRQPSPNWKTFTINDIAVFRDSIGKTAAAIPGIGTAASTPTLGSPATATANKQLLGTPDSDIGQQHGEQETADMADLEKLQQQTKQAVTRAAVGNEHGSSKPINTMIIYDVATLQFNNI